MSKHEDVDSIDPMIETIANESATFEEYARRADAYASTLARKPTQRALIDAWCVCRGYSSREQRTLSAKMRRKLRDAAEKRNEKRNELWGSLCKSINDDNEEG